MHKISLGNHVKCWISCHTLYPEKQRNIVIWKSLPDNLNPPSHCCCWQNHNSKGSKTNFNFVINYLAHEFPMNEIKVLQELHSLPLPGYIATILWSIFVRLLSLEIWFIMRKNAWYQIFSKHCCSQAPPLSMLQAYSLLSHARPPKGSVSLGPCRPHRH